MFIHSEYAHRKGAKNAKCIRVFIREFLCDLCVSAVKAVFMDGPLLGRLLNNHQIGRFGQRVITE
jgi:hypothetical protein